MKQGFSLIELSIGLFLSSLIGTALYNAFFVTNRVVSIADALITTDLRAALLENQLEKDIAGVFIPENAVAASQESTKTAQKNAKNNDEKKATVENEKKSKPIEKIFYAENGAQGSLSLITFISNNPVKVYQKAANDVPKPRSVRIVYRVIQDSEDDQLLSLVRQESGELDLQAYDMNAAKKIRAYEIVSGIKSISCEYFYPEQKEHENADAQKKKEHQKPDYKSVSVWNSDAAKDEQRAIPKIPEFIRCTCQIIDARNREETFVFMFQIPTFSAQTAQKEEQQAQKKSSEKKPKSDQKNDKESGKKDEQPSIQGASALKPIASILGNLNETMHT